MPDRDAQASQVAAERPNKGRALLIAGVVVRFPADLEPHKPQLTIMNQVIRSLQRTQNALIESPTGTGKSLALLCSSLAWLETEKQRARGNDAARNVSSESASMKNEENRSGVEVDHHSSNFDVDDDDDDFTTRPAPRYRQPSINVTVQHSTYVFGKPGSPSLAGGRTVCRVETSAAFAQARAEDASKPTHTRIFFCSRTHGQLSQIVEEMRRTPYADRMRATLLASREHYCIHSDVQALPKSMQTDACQRAIQQSLAEGGTAFARVASNALADTPGEVSACYRHLYAPVRRTACLAPQPFQIEDIVQVGRRWHGCPYFAARFLVEGDVNPSASSGATESTGLVREETPSADIAPPGESVTKSMRTAARLRSGIDPADIIFCPYSYLVDPIVRKRMGIDVTGAVVILDEAHNIEEACLEAASVDLTLSQVQRICQRLDEYLGSAESEHCPMPESSASMGTRLSGEQLLRVWQHWLHAIVAWIETLTPELDDCTDAQATRRSSWSRRTGVQHLRGQTAVFWQDGAMLHELETGLFGTWNFSHWEHSFNQLRGHVDRLRIKGQPTGHAIASAQAADETKVGSSLSSSADSEQKPRAGIEIDPEYEPVLSRHCIEVLHLLERFHVVLQYIYRGQYESEQRSNPDSTFLYAADYRLVLRREASNETARSVEYRLGLWCMNPAVTFGYLREHARSIVLTSGTLSPMDSFRSELATNFAYQADCDHIVDAAKQVQICVVGSVPSGVQLEGSYRNSATWAYQDAVGEALHHCCAQVPDGVLCFLPSYRVLESMLQRWISTGAIERIRGEKRLFIEQASGQEPLEWTGRHLRTLGGSRKAKTWSASRVLSEQNHSNADSSFDRDTVSLRLCASDSQIAGSRPKRKRCGRNRKNEATEEYPNRDMLRAFYAAVDAARLERETLSTSRANRETPPGSLPRHAGALMLAVCRGKVSEGLNFADHYGRAVIMVGIPYPNITDSFIQLKMRYNDERIGGASALQASRLTGKQWYTLQAYRTVNQALGRCIRNPKDYASVILLDVRYREVSTMSRLCRWIRDPLRVYVARHGPQLPLEATETALAAFFASKDDKTPTESSKDLVPAPADRPMARIATSPAPFR